MRTSRSASVRSSTMPLRRRERRAEQAVLLKRCLPHPLRPVLLSVVEKDRNMRRVPGLFFAIRTSMRSASSSCAWGERTSCCVSSRHSAAQPRSMARPASLRAGLCRNRPAKSDEESTYIRPCSAREGILLSLAAVACSRWLFPVPGRPRSRRGL